MAEATDSSPQPEPDLSIVDTDVLVEELRARCRAMVLVFVPASVDGEDYSDILVHRGLAWEVKGLAKHAADVLGQRFPGRYVAADEDDIDSPDPNV